jgi:hypothetical protein
LFNWCWFIFKDFKDINDYYKLAAIALNAAFLFFDDADFTNFNAADLTRLVLDDFLLTAVLLPVVVCAFAVFFAVVLRFAVRLVVVFLRLETAILLMF